MRRRRRAWAAAGAAAQRGFLGRWRARGGVRGGGVAGRGGVVRRGRLPPSSPPFEREVLFALFSIAGALHVRERGPRAQGRPELLQARRSPSRPYSSDSGRRGRSLEALERRDGSLAAPQGRQPRRVARARGQPEVGKRWRGAARGRVADAGA